MSTEQQSRKLSLDEAIKATLANLPKHLEAMGDELRHIIRACLQQYIAKMDFVPRDLFDAQVKVLQRCQEDLKALQAKQAKQK
jgi:BMFP domain-containing protein YqiC